MEAIKKYSVKIDYELQGSGVLVKVDNENCYLITVKHNFKEEGDESHLDVNTNNLILHDIKISTPNQSEVCQVEKIVYKEDGLDLLIFKIKSDSNYIKNLPSIEVIKDRHTINKKHFFYGFPNGEETPSGELTPLTFKVKEQEKHILTLRGDKTLYEDDEKGFSGSGVFIKHGDKENGYSYYLTGIITEVHQGQSYFESIVLSEIIDKINDTLNPKIEIKEDIIDVGFSKNIYSRLLKRNKNTYLVQRVIQESNNQNKLSFLEENKEKREDITTFLDNDKDELIKWEKTLADLYLLKAIIYNADGNKSDANFYLRKAKKFNNSFKRYELDTLLVDESTEEIQNNKEFSILEKAKLYYIDEKYDKAIEFFQQVEISSELEELDINNYLALCYRKMKEYEKAKECYSQILRIYDKKYFSEKTEIYFLEKAGIYYELALLSEKEEALIWLNEGLNLVKGNNRHLTKLKKFRFTSSLRLLTLQDFEYQRIEFYKKSNNSEFLEIKYKLEKYQDELLSIKRKTINQTLIQLAKDNPEYLKDFLEEYLKIQNEEITPILIYQKLEELHRDVKGMKNNEKKN